MNQVPELFTTSINVEPTTIPDAFVIDPPRPTRTHGGFLVLHRHANECLLALDMNQDTTTEDGSHHCCWTINGHCESTGELISERRGSAEHISGMYSMDYGYGRRSRNGAYMFCRTIPSMLAQTKCSCSKLTKYVTKCTCFLKLYFLLR